MENITTKLTVTGIFFLLMILSGVLLSKKGKPYRKGLMAIHKIISLVTIVLSVLFVIDLLKEVGSDNLPVAFLWIGGALFLLSFFTGVALSFEKAVPEPVTRAHKISSLLLIVSIIATAYLMVA